ncbi:MAG: hypothetical protein ABI700_21845, partial [Chloroflexota bacterium]
MIIEIACDSRWVGFSEAEKAEGQEDGNSRTNLYMCALLFSPRPLEFTPQTHPTIVRRVPKADTAPCCRCDKTRLV